MTAGIAKSIESGDPPNLSDTLALPLELNEGDNYEIVPWSSRYPTTDYLSELIEPVAQMYIDLADTYPSDNRNVRDFYRELKLFGAWISLFHDPESVSPTLVDALENDFYEPDRGGTRLPMSTMQEHDYPTNRATYRNSWWLRPDAVWSNGFQEDINTLLHGEEGSHYAEFHEKLREGAENNGSE